MEIVGKTETGEVKVFAMTPLDGLLGVVSA